MSTFFTTKYQCYRTHRVYHLPGYIDSFDEYKQQFRKESYALWGVFKYSSTVLYEEIIPNYVIILEMFLPFSSEWKSSCPEDIRMQFE